MKTPFIYTLSLFLCFASGLQAQTFSSRKLAEIGELLPKTCLPPTDSIFNCPQITKGKAFVIQYNGKNEIEHLGVSLFSAETKDMINRPVCDFIERMMLELLLQKSSADVKSKLREYKINLQRNGVEYGKSYFTSLTQLLVDVQYPTRFTIHKDSVYTAFWEFGVSESLSMTFPASRELIFGTDKKESDVTVGEWLMNDDCQNNFNGFTPEMISESELRPIAGTDLYKREGEKFMIDQINSDTYYQRSDDFYSLIFDPACSRESLANIFISKQIKNSLYLKITHRMYGGFTPEFTIPLNRFICLFDKEFTTYCLLYPPDSKSVKISIVLHNRNFNYIHLLRIHTTIEQLFAGDGILAADFYTNIPQHNLKSLF